VVVTETVQDGVSARYGRDRERQRRMERSVWS